MVNSLNQWLEYINQAHSKKIDMTLERVTAVAHKLQLFPFEPFSITVAGTNGKGTTAGFLETSLSAAGYKVGTMASPHLLRFNERLRLNGQEIADEEICAAFEKIEQLRGEISLSYFEYVTLAGLYLFKNAKVDIAILEVGMGGRLDAVNIIDTDLAIITNIALDHMEYLGPDRESIGREKAGILRPKIPLIYGETDMPNSIRDISLKLQNRLFQFGIDYTTQPIPSLIPAENVANALQALKIIHDKFPVSQEIISNTIRHFSLQGRWQIINNHIYDVAHNPHGIQALKNFLEQQPCHGKTLAIFSMLKTKDLAASVRVISPLINHWYVAPLQQELSFSKLELAQALEPHVSSFDSLPLAYAAAQSTLSTHDRLVVFGSFHTVAEIRALAV